MHRDNYGMREGASTSTRATISRSSSRKPCLGCLLICLDVEVICELICLVEISCEYPASLVCLLDIIL
jgi:hypothetical protein